MDRRTFITTAAVAPLATGLVAHATPSTDTALTALIEELENPPGYETGSMHWTKAFAAGEIRKALGMAIPDCENRDQYHDMCKGHFEAQQRCLTNWGAV